jgi:hypothetical protein
VHCYLLIYFYTCQPFETAPSFIRSSKDCCLISHGNKNVRCSGAILALLLHLLTLEDECTVCFRNVENCLPNNTWLPLRKLESSIFALCLYEEIFVTTFNIKNEMCNYVHVPLMVAQWLRYCATNRKVTGSIPDGVIGIFH